MGGLGNQLFQYAYGKALSLEKNEEMSLDISWYRGRISRTYMLKHFAITSEEVSPFKLFTVKLFSKEKYLSDPLGEWHKEKYFKKYSDVIRKEFTLKEPLSDTSTTLLKKIRATNSVSIHLRGGDYLLGNKSGFHSICSPEYYTDALEIISKEISSPHFYIFTDDIPWAKEHIKLPVEHTFVSNGTNPPHEELFLMSSCKHNITANSTFSWWAAWLGTTEKNGGKIVITPKKWFNDSALDTSELLPPNWIQL